MILEIVNFSCNPDVGCIDHWMLQFWRLRALEVMVLEFLPTHPKNHASHKSQVATKRIWEMLNKTNLGIFIGSIFYAVSALTVIPFETTTMGDNFMQRFRAFVNKRSFKVNSRTV